MTCNPNWHEIKENLKPYEEGQNRAKLIDRVFHAKVEQLKMHFSRITFPEKLVLTLTGLPHAHFLLILETNCKMHTPEDFDKIVSAKLPSQNANPHLFMMVVQHMIHSPYGSLNPFTVCMKKKDDEYPLYLRLNNRSKVKFRGDIFNNKWGVRYNAYLLCKFNCHINIEICPSI
uniref:Helitron helicase-like domain-containing protein n=1 Tax=Lactuca sativa TaxID=4236 RepID=A0A9R1UH78_LACSA|nr:hypothetical protein LSAT_V11C900487840 [Lactuca sativa]